ncbi:phospholipase D-like domain-containing protein [Glycomyces sp. L485]|uniref:phospholipase D-like domain-containing protein n=1 Tax=Glycomyces sp. L485 TaxID=2909235 RepID=UPI001F4AE7BB|nr:phospholipase D-like domain-containing protein [Glycomyces sp. L485]MCH7230108.1 phospholipase D-like domain-containing protein [Glycomyces sp. L485]
MNWSARQGPRPTRGNSVEFLIDNEAAWGRLAEEVGSARRSVRCMLFLLDLPHVRMSFDERIVGRPGAPGSTRLEERLVSAARRGAEVSLLLNHVEPAISPVNTSRPVERFFKRRGVPARVRLRRFHTPQAAPIHAKVFLVDDAVAFSIGSMFTQEFFDCTAHHLDDPRRGHVRWRSAIRVPAHDVSARITGPAVADLDATFRLHWNLSGPADLPEFAPPAEAAQGDLSAQVTRTLHGGRFPDLPGGETGILESYLNAIANAKEFIYLENQYLTSDDIVDALVDALRGNDRLHLIALINNRPDIPRYTQWQPEALERLYSSLSGPDAAERIGIYTLWSHEHGSIIRTHVHSKAAVVDDTWATVGSANLDGLSLAASEHARAAAWPVRLAGRVVGAFGPENPDDVRSTEVNLAIADFDGDRPESTRARIADLRRRLWSEHLGLDLTAPELHDPPDGGWNSLWRVRAEAKLRRLRRSPGEPSASRVLPFPRQGTRIPDGVDKSATYLRELGVATDAVEVRERFRSFSFDKGAWKRR